MQTFWECYEHWIKDRFCKEKGDLSYHCPGDLLKPSGLISQCALLRCGPWRLNRLHFVCLGPFRNKMENAALITSRPFFISRRPVPPHLTYFHQHLEDQQPLKEQVALKQIMFPPSATERQKQSVLPAAIMGICFPWLPCNCAFRAHSQLVNEEQAGWQNKDSFCGNVYLLCGLFETKWLSPLNLSAFATRKETNIKVFLSG